MTKRQDARQNPVMVRVWDPLVRIFHWSLVASIAFAWLSSDSRGELHQWIGYSAVALIIVRLLWGFTGTSYARFSQFIRSPRTVLGYLRAIKTGDEPRYIGHNPAGGYMIIALMLAVGTTGFTGWMMTTNTYYGDDWVQIVHSLSADGMILLVIAHVSGVVLASFRHRENLVKSMVTGVKRKAEADDVQ